ncbi:MAG: hypothetical protein J4215_01580 [Candidatus Diapherotrites archaeon]|uniref:Uncharacterized protein n=1 Tax=Candidatus Iainarchaeum sp. TaxID=3101447 RepID=A0A8T4L1W2_9ARCH|nr:hypothetical protein [Candidatus Diapherotrites archaeon]
MPKPRKERPGGKENRKKKAIQAFRDAHDRFVKSQQQYRIEQKKYRLLLESEKWLSPLRMARHGNQLAWRAITSLQHEQEFHNAMFRLAIDYPDTIRLPDWINRRMIEAAANLEEMETLRDESQRNFNSFREIWKVAVPRLVKAVKATPRYEQLRMHLREKRKLAVQAEESFDQFAQKIWADPKISDPQKVRSLAEAETFVSNAKMVQEETEIHFIQFARAVAVKVNASHGPKISQSLIDELARQIYTHRQLARIYSTRGRTR